MVTLSTKGRYATRILVYLAAQPQGLASAKQEIARAEGISADYVEQIMVRLRAAGLVNSKRGVNGGFLLAKPARDIPVLEAVEAAEGPLDLVRDCADGCARTTECVTRDLWKKASEALRGSLASVTVQELANRARAIQERQGPVFHI